MKMLNPNYLWQLTHCGWLVKLLTVKKVQLYVHSHISFVKQLCQSLLHPITLILKEPQHVYIYKYVSCSVTKRWKQCGIGPCIITYVTRCVKLIQPYKRKIIYPTEEPIAIALDHFVKIRNCGFHKLY